MDCNLKMYFIGFVHKHYLMSTSLIGVVVRHLKRSRLYSREFSPIRQAYQWNIWRRTCVGRFLRVKDSYLPSTPCIVTSLSLPLSFSLNITHTHSISKILSKAHLFKIKSSTKWFLLQWLRSWTFQDFLHKTTPVWSPGDGVRTFTALRVDPEGSIVG